MRNAPVIVSMAIAIAAIPLVVSDLPYSPLTAQSATGGGGAGRNWTFAREPLVSVLDDAAENLRGVRPGEKGVVLKRFRVANLAARKDPTARIRLDSFVLSVAPEGIGATLFENVRVLSDADGDAEPERNEGWNATVDGDEITLIVSPRSSDIFRSDGKYTAVEVLADVRTNIPSWVNYFSARFSEPKPKKRASFITANMAMPVSRALSTVRRSADPCSIPTGCDIVYTTALAPRLIDRCGDGTVQTGEQCDDGNTANDDGCSNACMTEIAGEPLSRGLILHLPLDEAGPLDRPRNLADPDPTRPTDGVPNGSTPTTDVAPRFDPATSRSRLFTDPSDSVRITTRDNPRFDLQKFSVAFWLKTTTQPSTFQAFLGRTDEGNQWNRGFGFYPDTDVYSDPKMKFFVGNWLTFAAGSADFRIWHHYVGTYDGEIIRIYIDGREVSWAPFKGPVEWGDTDLILGYLSTPRYAARPMLLDDVRMYNRALSPAETMQLATGSAPATSSASSLSAASSSTAAGSCPTGHICSVSVFSNQCVTIAIDCQPPAQLICSRSCGTSACGGQCCKCVSTGGSSSASSTPVAGDPLERDLIAHWKLDETWAGDIIRNSATTGEVFDGQRPNGSAPTTDIAPGFPASSRARYFKLPQDAIRIPLSPVLDLQKFSVAFWMKTEARPPTHQAFLGRANGEWSDQGFGFYPETSNDQKGWFMRFFVGNWLRFAEGSTEFRTWNHYVGTYDGEMTRLFINGKEAAAVPYKGPVDWGDNPLVLGQLGSSKYAARPMTLDDVRIYGRALSAADVAQLAGDGGGK